MSYQFDLPIVPEDAAKVARRHLDVYVRFDDPREPLLVVTEVVNNSLRRWTATIPVAVLQALSGFAQVAAKIAAASAQSIVEDEVRGALRRVEDEVRGALRRVLGRVMQEG